jgi:hypothetical protein
MWNQSEVSSLANPVEAKKIGYVYSVILDENDEYASKSLFKSSLIGAIRFRTTDNQTPNDKNIPIAFPFDKNCKTLPVIGEQVEIYGQPGNYSYKRIGAEPNPSYSAKRRINEQFQPKSDSTADSSKYNENAVTGTPDTTNNTKNDELDKLGKYSLKGVTRQVLFLFLNDRGNFNRSLCE